MNIYLMRHGDTVYQTPDDLSPLSAKGENEIDELARFLLPLQLSMRVFHSEKLRAKQTAERISAGIFVQGKILSKEGLRPNDSVLSVAEELNEMHSDILLVGHMPFMGKLAAQLVCQNADRDVVQFHKGTIVCLRRMSQDQWAIEWVIHPGLLGGLHE